MKKIIVTALSFVIAMGFVIMVPQDASADAGRFDLYSGDQPFGTDTEISNVHDGETFEIIPVESYDPATNTITFRTKSFSNYAIAVKDSRKGGSKGPGTGDDNSIIPDLVIMITAGLALAGIGLKRRYDR